MDRKALFDYLPPFMQQFKEMQELMKSVDFHADFANLNLERTLNSAFILDCDESFLMKYESMLNIIPSEDDTLEERKKRVLSEWMDNNNFTLKILKKKLTEFVGENNFEIKDDTDLINYFLHLEVKIKDVLINDILEYLKKRLPANLYSQYEFIFNHDSDTAVAFITVLYLTYENDTEEFDLSDLDYLVDEDGNMLLDESGNVLLD